MSRRESDVQNLMHTARNSPPLKVLGTYQRQLSDASKFLVSVSPVRLQ